MGNVLLERPTTDSSLPTEPHEIRCLPQGICSWNYWLTGSGKRCELYLNRFFSGGYIEQGATSLEVAKVGFLLPRWELRDGETELVTATQNSILSRNLTLEDDRQSWDLTPTSMFGGAYTLEQEGSLCAMIRRDHALTRRATITVHNPEVDFVILAFSFWMVAHRWRSDSQNNS